MGRTEQSQGSFHTVACTVLLVVAVLAVPGRADAKHWALVVGIDKYDDPQVSALNGAVNDAKNLEQTLSDVLGIAKDSVFLFVSDDTSKTRRPTKGNIIRGLRYVAKEATAEDTFIMFFAGHGISHGKTSYLLTYYSQTGALVDTALPVPRLLELLGEIKVSKKLIMLDTCRNDPESGRGDVDNRLDEAFARGLDVRTRQSAGGRQSSVAVLFSSSLNERAYEIPGKNRGFFSHYIEKGLGGEAVDMTGAITISSLVSYLQEHVPKAVRKGVGPDASQVPHVRFEGGDPAKWVLVRHKRSADRTAPLVPPTDYGSLVADAEAQLVEETEQKQAYMVACKAAWAKVQQVLEMAHLSLDKRISVVDRFTADCESADPMNKWARQAASILKRKRTNGSLTIRTTPIDASIYVGATLVEDGLRQLDLPAGQYVVTALKRTGIGFHGRADVASKSVRVVAGEVEELHLAVVRDTTAAVREYANAPEWVLNALEKGVAGSTVRADSGPVHTTGVGSATGLNPALMRHVAFVRAISGLSVQIRRYLNGLCPGKVEENQLAQEQLRASVSEVWHSPGGRLWLRAEADSDWLEDLSSRGCGEGDDYPGSEPSWVSTGLTGSCTLGVADVVAYGQNNDAAHHAAELAATVLGLRELVIQVHGCRLEVYQEAVIHDSRYSYDENVEMLFRHEFPHRSGAIKVTSYSRLGEGVGRSSTDGSRQFDPWGDDLVKIDISADLKELQLSVFNGTLELPEQVPPTQALVLLRKALKAAGIAVTYVVPLDPVNGAPVVEVTLVYSPP